mgnify:CR=1 FL=1
MARMFAAHLLIGHPIQAAPLTYDGAQFFIIF